MNVARKTIFLVDDNETNLVMGREVLAEAYTVLTLNSGAQLFKVLEKRVPDLILLDVEMPEMDGYEVIRRLKAGAATAGIPVIFLTALADEAEELKGLSRGAVDYITKPFSAPILLKRVETHLLVESQKQALIEYSIDLEKLVDDKLQEITELKNALIETMAELVEYRDAVTGTHIERTQKFVEILIDAMKENGVYADESLRLDARLASQSAQLHDVGKISVSDAILNKPGRLTAEEFDKIKNHTAVGDRIIAQMQQRAHDSAFLEYAKAFAASHHEKWDGSGYPCGLAGEDIPLLGRVMAIADVYDALISQRPYKDALPHASAVEIIKSDSGTHFDPALVDLFLGVQNEFEQIAAGR